MPVQSKLPVILVVIVVVAITAGTWFIRRGGAETPVEPVQAAPVADAATPLPRSPPASPRGSEGRQTTPEDAIGRRAKLRGEYVENSRKKLAERVATYDREQVDPAWAPQKEVELGKIADSPAFATAGVEPKELRASCKSTMCRIDGSFDGGGNADDWLLIYMSSVGSSLPNAMVTRTRNPDGTVGVQIYGQAR